VNEIKQEVLDREEIEKFSDIFKVLGESTR